MIKYVICAWMLILSGQHAGLNASQIATYQTIDDYETEKNVDQLLLLIQKRLAIMHEVARTKWNNQIPIEDKLREQQILQALGAKAKDYALDEKWVLGFFEAQIEASKEMQRHDFANWEKEGVQKFDHVFSLKDDLRLYIDEINQEMFVLIAKIRKSETGMQRFVLSQPISVRASDEIDPAIWSLSTSTLRP